MKRIFDIVFALIFLIFVSPVIFIVSIMIKILMGSPIFFIQERSGMYGNPFNLIKFRTMTNNFEKKAESDVERTTKLGSILRKFSIDEFPTFINVLKGDMSVVGPRPLHTVYNLRYSEEQSRRLEAKPGITGWAQINGRNLISWNKKFEYDVWYVDNKSFLLDLKIIFLTFFKVFKTSDVNKNSSETMSEFMGDK